MKMSQQIGEEITSTCPTVCASFIYPMLDWSNDPTLAIFVTLGGCVVVPLCHAFLWGVYKVRLALWMHLKKSKIALALVKISEGPLHIAKNVVHIGGQRKTSETTKGSSRSGTLVLRKLSVKQGCQKTTEEVVQLDNRKFSNTRKVSIE